MRHGCRTDAPVHPHEVPAWLLDRRGGRAYRADRGNLGLRPRYGPPVTAAEVAAAKFRLVRLKPGYDMREVDEALDRYQEQLQDQGWA